MLLVVGAAASAAASSAAAMLVEREDAVAALELGVSCVARGIGAKDSGVTYTCVDVDVAWDSGVNSVATTGTGTGGGICTPYTLTSALTSLSSFRLMTLPHVMDVAAAT